MSRSRVPVIVTVAAVAVFAIALVAVGAAGSSQRGCVYCHADYTHAQVATAHASVQCNRCHAFGGIGGRLDMASRVVGQMVPAKLMNKKVAGPVTETSRQACLSCHAAINDTVISANGLRINHATCAKGASCDSCHSTTAHGAVTRWQRGPIMDDCMACHRGTGNVTCTTCHVSTESEVRPAGTTPWQVTHGPNWQHTHGMGLLTSCSACHPKDFCAECHKVQVPHEAAFGSQHGQLALQDRSSCLVCHQTETFCNACHGIQMPHPTDFLKVHSASAKSLGTTVCFRCHDQQSCDACHVAHVHPGFFGVTTSTVAPPVKKTSP